MRFFLMYVGMALIRSGGRGATNMFHTVTLCRVADKNDRPPYVPERREGQLWIWYAYEQQYYFTMMSFLEYLELFDNKVYAQLLKRLLTMKLTFSFIQVTYHNDSLAQVTFMCPWGTKKPADLFNPAPPKTKEKLVRFL